MLAQLHPVRGGSWRISISAPLSSGTDLEVCSTQSLWESLGWDWDPVYPQRWPVHWHTFYLSFLPSLFDFFRPLLCFPGLSPNKLPVPEFLSPGLLWGKSKLRQANLVRNLPGTQSILSAASPSTPSTNTRVWQERCQKKVLGCQGVLVASGLTSTVAMLTSFLCF